MKQPQFTKITFTDQEAFGNWLNEHTFKLIHLDGYDSDMSTIWVHETGEILHSDFHSRIYSGRFLNMNKLVVGNPLHIWDDQKNRYVFYGGLVVDALS